MLEAVRRKTQSEGWFMMLWQGKKLRLRYDFYLYVMDLLTVDCSAA